MSMGTFSKILFCLLVINNIGMHIIFCANNNNNHTNVKNGTTKIQEKNAVNSTKAAQSRQSHVIATPRGNLRKI